MDKLNDGRREKCICRKTDKSIEIDFKRLDKPIGKAGIHDTNE